jgi:hypothetical protein
MMARWAKWAVRSFQQPLQFLRPVGNFGLEFGEAGEDFLGRIVIHHLVDDFLVAVEREVVVVGGDVGLGDEEARIGALCLKRDQRRWSCCGVKLGSSIGFLSRLALCSLRVRSSSRSLMKSR